MQAHPNPNDGMHGGPRRFPAPSILLAAVLPLLIPPALQAEATVTGTVTNTATGRTLEGARIVIEATGREVLSESDGTFRLDDVPAGELRLTVSYTGLDTTVIPVTVMSGATRQIDVGLTSSVYQLDKFVVAGEREGNALAVTRQRQADNVKNVVSADAFGSLSGNPSELLERITGVVVERVGGDPRFISIRGIPGELNSIQIDGTRRATSGDRGLNFESIGSDHIESMELIKAPTPDMDADAIGGTVNLKSRSGFDIRGRRITYALGTIIGYKRYPEPIPAGSFAYSDVFSVFGGSRNLGVSFSTSFRQHIACMDFATMLRERTENQPAYTYSLAYDGRMNRRTRYGGGLKLDYKLSDRNSVFLSFTYSPHRENSVVPITTVSTAQTVAALDAQGRPTGTGAILPGYTDLRTEARAVPQSQVALSNLHRQRDANAWSLQAGGRWRRPGHELDYDTSYSYSYNNQYLHTVTASLPGVGFVIDSTNTSPWTPAISFTAGPDPADLNNYVNNSLLFTHTPTTGEVYGAQVNYRKSFQLPGAPSYLKAGVRVRREDQLLENFSRRWNFTGADGRLNSGDENLRQFQDLNLDYRPMHGVYPAGPILSPDAMRTHKDQNLGLWPEDLQFGANNPLSGRRSLQETVSAAYVMGHTRLDRLSILAGVRVEKTDVWAEGPLDRITAEERARRAAFVGPLTPEEAARRATAQFGTFRTVERDYQNVFPGVHLKYEPRNGLLLRGSYSSSIGRPGFGSLIPFDNINEDTRVITANNPGLKPQYSDNFDATIEYYFEPAGQLSFGVFLKEMSDFIYTATGQIVLSGADNGFGGDYAGFELRSPANGGWARMKGWEANYSQRFTFLPGWWSGFGAFANYTWLETKGNYGGTTTQTSGTLAGFTPRAANAGISYIRGKYTVRIIYGHNAETLLAFNAMPNLRRYRLPTHRIDLKLKYVVSRNLDVYLDLYNVFNDKQSEYWGVYDRPRTSLNRNDPQIHFGVNGRL